jgi:hypothetical protein
MVSRVFKEAPKGRTLEAFRQDLADVAEGLEAERAAAEEAERAAREAAEKEHSGRKPKEIERFARVYVGPVLLDPRDKSQSFLVSHSEEDHVALMRIDRALARLDVLEKSSSAWFTEHGDPYLGDPRPA